MFAAKGQVEYWELSRALVTALTMAGEVIPLHAGLSPIPSQPPFTKTNGIHLAVKLLLIYIFFALDSIPLSVSP